MKRLAHFLRALADRIEPLSEGDKLNALMKRNHGVTLVQANVLAAELRERNHTAIARRRFLRSVH